MKVLNLQCAHQHAFEGWFASEEDFQNQLSRGLVECPLCADRAVQKLPSAPRLNLGAHEAASAPARVGAGATAQAAPVPAQTDSHPAASEVPVPAAFLRALRHLVANTEDVGERFAEEARRMHYGETAVRSIRGQASLKETGELLEEGIEVMPLPLPPALKETLQ